MKNRLRQPMIPRSGQNGKKVESKIPASDQTKLKWKDSMDPLSNAANALNLVIAQQRDRVVRECAKDENIDLSEFVLNVDTMEWQSRDHTVSPATG